MRITRYFNSFHMVPMNLDKKVNVQHSVSRA